MEVDAECNKGNGKEKKDEKIEEKARGKGESFAGRYMPQSELKATKYQAIRDTFVQSLSARLQPQYKFQDKGYYFRVCLLLAVLKVRPHMPWPAPIAALQQSAGPVLQGLSREAEECNSKLDLRGSL